MLIYARVCGLACMRYRLGGINYVYGYIYKCMLVFASASTFFFLTS